MDKKWWTLLAVCGGTFMLLLDLNIVVVAIPEIQAGLHASFSDLQWVIDAYALTLASLMLTSGSLADLYGRRRLFALGLVIFTAGSLLCGLAQSPLMLILSRSGQGVGGAIIFATSLALLAQSFRGKDRGVAFGVWGAITGAAVALGPILGGLITSGISWRGIFLVNVPIGIAVIAMTLAKVDESRAQRAPRPDWLGFALLTAGLVSLVYGLIRASEIGWGDGGVVACLICSGLLLMGFVFAERCSAQPMLDLELFRIPTFVGGLIAAFAMNASLFAMFLYLVIYLQDALGYSAVATGLRLLLVTGALLIASTAAGRASSRVPMKWLIGPGLGLVGLGLLLMSGLDGSSSWRHLIGGFVVAGIGAGMVNPPLASTAVGVVAPERAGMASGVNSTFRQIGVATAIAGLGSVFATSLPRHLDHALIATPTLRGRGPQIAAAVRHGDTAHLFDATPAALRDTLGAAIRSSFATGVNELLIITGVVALLGAVCALVLIRNKDLRLRP